MKRSYLEKKGGDPSASKDEAELIKIATARRCDTACSFAAREIVLKYQDKFDRLALVTGWGNPQDHPFKGDWELHFRLVARDREGKWFSISPANINGSQDNTCVIEADSMPEMADKMTKSDGGLWPKGEANYEKCKLDVAGKGEYKVKYGWLARSPQEKKLDK